MPETMPWPILALEAPWGESDDTRTVRSGLRMLFEIEGVPYTHHKVTGRQALLNRLKEAEGEAPGIVYLATHGTEGTIWLPNGGLTLAELAEACPGSFQNKIVHFGACKTVLDEAQIRPFLRMTGARAVSGYCKNIEFLDSMLLDLAYFGGLQNYPVQVARITDYLTVKYGQLVSRLGFRIYVR